MDGNSVWELIKPQTSRCPTQLRIQMNQIDKANNFIHH